MQTSQANSDLGSQVEGFKSSGETGPGLESNGEGSRAGVLRTGGREGGAGEACSGQGWGVGNPEVPRGELRTGTRVYVSRGTGSAQDRGPGGWRVIRAAGIGGAKDRRAQGAWTQVPGYVGWGQGLGQCQERLFGCGDLWDNLLGSDTPNWCSSPCSHSRIVAAPGRPPAWPRRRGSRPAASRGTSLWTPGISGLLLNGHGAEATSTESCLSLQ